MRFGAVLKSAKSGFENSKMLRCGSVRFSEIRNPTVRFGAVFRYSKSYGAVRCCDKSYGAGPISVGKTVHNRFFSTVHRMNKPHKTAVSYGYQAFLGAIAKPLFIYSTPYE